jgi:hypothetical protein
MPRRWYSAFLRDSSLILRDALAALHRVPVSTIDMPVEIAGEFFADETDVASRRLLSLLRLT